MKKRILGILAVLALCLPLLSATALATGPEGLKVSFFKTTTITTKSIGWTPILAAFDTSTGIHFLENGGNSRDDKVNGSYTVQWYNGDQPLDAAPTDAGEYTIKVTLDASLAGQYSLTNDTLTYTIEHLDLSKANVGLKTYTYPKYTGSPVMPTNITVGNSGYTIPEENYTFADVEDKNNTEPGQAYFKVIGQKNVTGEKEFLYYISKIGTTLPEATTHTYTYDGTPKATAADFSGQVTLPGDIAATVTPLEWRDSSNKKLSGAPSAVGTYTVRLKYVPVDSDHYSTEYRYETFTIQPRKLTANVQFDTTKVYDTSTNVYYNGATNSTSLPCNPLNVVDGDTILLTASAKYDTADVGTNKTITVNFSLSGDDKGNYTAPDSYTVTTGEITPKEVTVSPEYPSTRFWDGTTAVALTKEGWTMTGHYSSVDNLELDLSGATAKVESADAGENKPVIFENVSFTGNGKGNYSITCQPRTINIQKLNLGSSSVTVTWTGDDPAYTGSTVYPANAVVTVQPSGQAAFTLDSSHWEFAPDDTLNSTAAGQAWAWITAKTGDQNVIEKKFITYTIEKANQDAPAAPVVKSKTYNSVTLETVADNVNGAKVQYSMDGGTTWQDSPEFTGLTASTEYSFAVRYAEERNYAASPASAELKVTTSAAPSSGGGSSSGGSSSTTTTEKNPDGSTTTTVTDKTTGTVTETTKNTDGSTTVVETKKDGTVTETNKSADGTSGTVVTDKNGNITEVKSSVSSTAAKQAAKTGEAVTLPVEVPAVKTTGDAPAVEVSVPKSVGSVKVEIPVEQVTPGTVAVIVNADGSEKIVSTSVVTDNGVALTLDGNATVKVIDNSKNFIDVSKNNVFYGEISSMSAREIMIGKTEDTFDLHSSVTLNQIANVAGRIAGAVDVKDYNGGIAWGQTNGLKTGNMAATRGDVLRALYVAAGSSTVTDTSILAKFNDASAIPADMKAFAAWAAQNGILKGNIDSNGALTANLDTTVTRCQACALAGRTLNMIG